MENVGLLSGGPPPGQALKAVSLTAQMNSLGTVCKYSVITPKAWKWKYMSGALSYMWLSCDQNQTVSLTHMSWSRTYICCKRMRESGRSFIMQEANKCMNKRVSLITNYFSTGC